MAVLGYHKIGAPPPPPKGWDSWFYVSESTFMEQVRELRERGWQPIDLATFLAGLERPESLPERSALITFDDGYLSMRARALPCMQELGVPGVLFMPSDHVGGSNRFDHGVEPEEPLCGWDDLRVLDAAGLAVQSHAASHRSFSSLDSRERDAELRRSRQALEAGLGAPIHTIAFPYGDPGPDADREQAREAGYRAAFLYRGGPVELPLADPFRIERIAMGPDTDLAAALEGEA